MSAPCYVCKEPATQHFTVPVGIPEPEWFKRTYKDLDLCDGCAHHMLSELLSSMEDYIPNLGVCEGHLFMQDILAKNGIMKDRLK